MINRTTIFRLIATTTNERIVSRHGCTARNSRMVTNWQWIEKIFLYKNETFLLYALEALSNGSLD